VQILANIPSILVAADKTVYESWYKFIIGGVIMYTYVAIDWYWYKYYALEADVFIDVSGRSKEDRETFQQI